MHPDRLLNFSGARFSVVYQLSGDEAAARLKAEDICIEQTIEFPADLVPDGEIREHIFGRIEHFEALAEGGYCTEISYAVETSGFELPQLLNVVFGNISIKPGIRVLSLLLPDALLKAFRGPRFGIQGLRELTGVHERPLLCSALKPMGLSPAQLAELAYQLALGGMDMIKDDHGLANQSFAPFRERAARCAEAVAQANRQTGGTCLYFPNITAPADRLMENARFARDAGAGGVVVTPGLTGLDVMRLLADDDVFSLPVMSHPAFIGTFVTGAQQGLSHFVLYGQLMRLAGADASIFPNYGGRFSFSREACSEIAAGCWAEMGALRTIFPAPGGGMHLGRIAEMKDCYGSDVIFLVGGDLHRGEGGLVETTRRFRQMVEGEKGKKKIERRE